MKFPITIPRKEFIYFANDIIDFNRDVTILIDGYPEINILNRDKIISIDTLPENISIRYVDISMGLYFDAVYWRDGRRDQ